MFNFTCVHFCRKPNMDRDKLGRFGLGKVMPLLRKWRSLFDVSKSNVTLGTFRDICP